MARTKGNGVFQCRAKTDMKTGCLRMYPAGGTLYETDDAHGRSVMERRFNKHPSCYMRGVQAWAKVTRELAVIRTDFVVYSAMSHQPLARLGDDDQLVLRSISPFWVVMLAGRETSQMANVTAYMEEYSLVQPVAKKHGEVKAAASMQVHVPFLTNNRDLAPGDLMVLPFNGGLPQICCESFSPCRVIEE